VNVLVWQAGICTATCTSGGVAIYKMIVVNGVLPGA
jgi:heterodisulfide reductase subunit C